MRRLCSKMVAVQTVCVAVVAAGCSGGSEEPYGLSATEACLAAADGVEIRDREGVDLILDDAPGGALEVGLSGNVASIGFGRTSKDAERMMAGYRVWAAALETPINDIVFERRNVVIGFESSPTEAELETVEGCLS